MTSTAEGGRGVHLELTKVDEGGGGKTKVDVNFFKINLQNQIQIFIWEEEEEGLDDGYNRKLFQQINQLEQLE